MCSNHRNDIFHYTPAEVAHSVEHNLAKVGVASSSLVFRSKIKTNAGVAQLAECVPSKYEVAGSNPVTRSRALVIQPQREIDVSHSLG